MGQRSGRPRQHHGRPRPTRRPDLELEPNDTRGDASPVANFTIQVFQNEYLPAQATDVHAVASVTCSDAGAAGQTGAGAAAEVIIIDTSGSMDLPPTKISAARRAAKVALDEIVDGTSFAVI